MGKAVAVRAKVNSVNLKAAFTLLCIHRALTFEQKK